MLRTTCLLHYDRQVLRQLFEGRICGNAENVIGCGEKQWPTWALKSTFLGGVFMFIFGVGKVENLESKIVTLIEPVKTIGLSVKTRLRRFLVIFPVLGKT